VVTKEEVGACVGGRRARDDRVNERREKDMKDTYSWRGRNIFKKKEEVRRCFAPWALEAFSFFVHAKVRRVRRGKKVEEARPWSKKPPLSRVDWTRSKRH
jgi:hypothetical protein